MAAAHAKTQREREFAPGTLIDKTYLIDELLADGSVAAVYKAQDNLQRTVALKILHSEAAQIPERIDRFNNEACLAGLEGLKNVVIVYYLGVYERRPYFAMEFIDGETLGRISDRDDLKRNERLEIIMQVCEGLEWLHSKGIIHRDIKPSNIMVSRKAPELSVKILDLGVAVGQDADSSELTRQVGTPDYMSPEQSEGRCVDLRTDIFSLGLVLFELITAEKPKFEMPERNAGNLQPESLGLLRERCTLELQRVVKKALEEDRGQRYQTDAEFRTDLKRAQVDFAIRVHKAKRAVAWFRYDSAIAAIQALRSDVEGFPPLEDEVDDLLRQAREKRKHFQRLAALGAVAALLVAVAFTHIHYGSFRRALQSWASSLPAHQTFNSRSSSPQPPALGWVQLDPQPWANVVDIRRADGEDCILKPQGAVSGNDCGYRGPTPVILRLPPGVYRVTLEYGNSPSVTQQVTANAGGFMKYDQPMPGFDAERVVNDLLK